LRTHAASSGDEAIAVLSRAHAEHDPFALVLMDWRMPGMDGLEASRIIRASPGIAITPTIIMATAYDGEEFHAAARACVSMALEMQERILRLRGGWQRQGIPDPLRVRMGITTGLCTVGNFGSPHKIDYTIIGRPVNLAARLQAHAQPGTVLTSAETWQLVRDSFDCVAQPPIQVKGITEPVRTWIASSRRDVPRYSLDIEHARIDVRPDALAENERAKVRALLVELAKAMG
jgi:class 3 adenylate cyclase